MLKQVSVTRQRWKQLFLSHPAQEGRGLVLRALRRRLFQHDDWKAHGHQLSFSVDAAFVDNLFHLITNLPKRTRGETAIVGLDTLL